MDPKRKLTEQRFDRALQYLSDNATTILAAHETLGIPLEDLIAGGARRALTSLASDCDAQLNLTFSGADLANGKAAQS